MECNKDDVKNEHKDLETEIEQVRCFWPFENEEQERELEVSLLSRVGYWGRPGFGRFGCWRAGILAMGRCVRK